MTKKDTFGKQGLGIREVSKVFVFNRLGIATIRFKDGSEHVFSKDDVVIIGKTKS